MQTYRINAIGMLMNSPSNNLDDLYKNKHSLKLITSNSLIPKRSVRRLQKAVKHTLLLKTPLDAVI